jgi:cystathionine beta-synthase
VAESDLMSRVIEDPTVLDQPVESLMRAPYPVLDGHVDADEVTNLLQRGNDACLVRADGALLGIVTRYDVVRTLTGAVG